MTEGSELKKSIMDQIYDEMFDLLKDSGIDRETLARIRELARKDQLHVDKEVANVISIVPEE